MFFLDVTEMSLEAHLLESNGCICIFYYVQAVKRSDYELEMTLFVEFYIFIVYL